VLAITKMPIPLFRVMLAQVIDSNEKGPKIVSSGKIFSAASTHGGRHGDRVGRQGAGAIVFGGDGASFAVSVADAAQAQLAQSETATGSLTIWVRVCGLVYPA
jgi:hypothetical protein